MGSVCPQVCCLLLSADLSDRMAELEGRENLFLRILQMCLRNDP